MVCRLFPYVLLVPLGLCLGCVDQTDTLFERIQAPGPLTDASATAPAAPQDMCQPLRCGPQACGVRQDGCGQTLDCGPCVASRCPATFEVLKVNLTNPRLMVYRRQEDALFYTTSNGSHRIQTASLQAPESPSRQLTETGSVRQLVVTGDALYRSTASSSSVLWRTSLVEGGPARVRLDLESPVSALSSEPEGQRVWVTTTEPDALWSLQAPETELTKRTDLPEPPAPKLLAVTPELVWWVDTKGTLRALSQDSLTPLEMTWSFSGSLSLLRARQGQACLVVRTQEDASLWCVSPRRAQAEQIRSWQDSTVLDFRLLDSGRWLVARTTRPKLSEGWLVSVISATPPLESTLFFAPAGGVAPANDPLLTDGQCALIAYQYEARLQRDLPGDIGWVSIDRPPEKEAMSNK